MAEGVFAFRDDGDFPSSRCQLYCAFGWQGYRTWRHCQIAHVTATTRCPNAPHTVVWYGTVQRERRRFEGTWTMRWYWNRRIIMVGEGVLMEES